MLHRRWLRFRWPWSRFARFWWLRGHIERGSSSCFIQRRVGTRAVPGRVPAFSGRGGGLFLLEDVCKTSKIQPWNIWSGAAPVAFCAGALCSVRALCLCRPALHALLGIVCALFLLSRTTSLFLVAPLRKSGGWGSPNTLPITHERRSRGIGFTLTFISSLAFRRRLGIIGIAV